MASNKQSSFNSPRTGGLGFGLPQSQFQHDWHNDPRIIPVRRNARHAIMIYLRQYAASGEFTQQIFELAISLECEIFKAARSNEDYVNREVFYVRLQQLIQQKWSKAKVAQHDSVHTPASLSMYHAPQTFQTPGSFGANVQNSLPDYCMSANTNRAFISADNVNEPQLLAHVPRSGMDILDVTLQQPGGEVMPNNCSRWDVCSSGVPDDSGPTCCGSVLQYDSEPSLGSDDMKTRWSTEGELNQIVSSSRSSPSVHTPPVAGENLISEATTCSEEAHQVGTPQFEEQHLQVKLQSDVHSLENYDTGRVSMPNQSSYGFHDASSSTALHSCYDGTCQSSISVGVRRRGPASNLLDCYIAYNKNPVLRGGSKVPFLEYLHSQNCNSRTCICGNYKSLLSHFDRCGSADCNTGGPALWTRTARLIQPGLKCPRDGYKRMRTCPDTSEDFMNPTKRRKLNSYSPEKGSPNGVSVVTEDTICPQQSGSPVVVNPALADAKMELEPHSPTFIGEARNSAMDDIRGSISEGVPNPVEERSADLKQEIEPGTSCELKAADGCFQLPSDSVRSSCEQKFIAQEEEVMVEANPIQPKAEPSGESSQPTVEKSEKQKVDSITLMDFFTAEEIRQHISSLRKKADQSIAEEVETTASCSVNENFCQICALDRLAFSPMPIYCLVCGVRIKKNSTYYTSKDENHGHIFCSPCYSKGRGGLITFGGTSTLKNSLVSKKNNLATDEGWVQCDKCEGWQHMICSLYNGKRDLGEAEFVCPKCLLEDLETEKRMPLSRSTAYDARNLPPTLLSDYIEQRLFRRLRQEREERAMAAGKTAEEVPEATGLVVRVVSSVNKILKVKQQFLDIFPEKNYPAEFPYRSKVILLFQRIEGVDVCLFAMYVQEYGSECKPPNQRCVYISYLDSVKYFRPEIKAASGEALRTFVYHEILIGYLDYCKERGFTTCYIWACPPVKGEDYVLYCHPETQKTPQPEKLRQWYQLMIKKASKENTVVNVTNLYEKFFVPTGECNTKVTAARLPYFYGDYWSGIAETMIQKIEQEKPKISRRTLKSMSINNSNAIDALLMQQLGTRFASAKEDFIVVYLQYVCTHCHEVMLSGKRWFCNQCKNFQLCERCHSVRSEQGGIHISKSGQKHALTQEIVNDVPAYTEDNDVIMDNCFLDDRQSFINFLQGNHYQFDSLRRAKHSSMMVLFHLHNPIVSNTGTSCSLCLKVIGAEPRWKCEICPEINVCGTCCEKSNGFCHSHTLTRHPPISTSGAEKTAVMVRELLGVVLHASQCRTTSHLCSYPHCAVIRRLYSHTGTCKVRIAGGCRRCRKTWFVLLLHSRWCKDLNCGVPRCMELKKNAERLDLQSKTQQSNIIPDIRTHSVVSTQ